jgi:hypothetical protein
VANLGSPDYNFRDLHLVASNPVIFDKLKGFLESEIP